MSGMDSRVVGIDPGEKACGVAVVEVSSGEMVSAHARVIPVHEIREFLRSYSTARVFVEDGPLYVRPGANPCSIGETKVTVGRILAYANPDGNGADAARISRSEVVGILFGLERPKRVSDAQMRDAVIHAWGGYDAALGGAKCESCDGRGGTGRKPARVDCALCDGRGKSPTGPLYSIRGVHCWDALAVATAALMSEGCTAATGRRVGTHKERGK